MSNTYREISLSLMNAMISIHQNFIRREKVNMPINYFTLLAVLHDEGTLSIRDLSHLVVMSKQQLTPMIDKLVKNGSITKHIRSDDRRFTLLSLTEKGRAIIEDFHEQLRHRLEDALKTLPNEDLTKLADSLNIFNASISKMIENTK